MLAGLRRSGKSTLADIVEGEVSDHRHREDCYFRTRTFEVPGGYVENHWMAKEIIMLDDPETLAYLDVLARLNRAVARRADRVYEVVCGIPIAWKGANP